MTPRVRSHLNTVVKSISARRADLVKRQTEARAASSAAIRRGDLVAPDVCQSCRTLPVTWENKPTSLQFHHHEGYAKENQLVGQWLCPKCHRSSSHYEREEIEELEKKHTIACRLWIMHDGEPLRVKCLMDGAGTTRLHDSSYRRFGHSVVHLTRRAAIKSAISQLKNAEFYLLLRIRQEEMRIKSDIERLKSLLVPVTPG